MKQEVEDGDWNNIVKTVWILGVFGMNVCLNSSHKKNKKIINPVFFLFLVFVIESNQLVYNV